MTSICRCLELPVRQDAEADRASVARLSLIAPSSCNAMTFRRLSVMVRPAIDGYVPCEKNLAMEIRIGNRMVRAEVARNQLKALRRQIITDLFMPFANNAGSVF